MGITIGLEAAEREVEEPQPAPLPGHSSVVVVGVPGAYQDYVYSRILATAQAEEARLRARQGDLMLGGWAEEGAAPPLNPFDPASDEETQTDEDLGEGFNFMPPVYRTPFPLQAPSAAWLQDNMQDVLQNGAKWPPEAPDQSTVAPKVADQNPRGQNGAGQNPVRQDPRPQDTTPQDFVAQPVDGARLALPHTSPGSGVAPPRPGTLPAKGPLERRRKRKRGTRPVTHTLEKPAPFLVQVQVDYTPRPAQRLVGGGVSASKARAMLARRLMSHKRTVAMAVLAQLKGVPAFEDVHTAFGQLVDEKVARLQDLGVPQQIADLETKFAGAGTQTEKKKLAKTLQAPRQQMYRARRQESWVLNQIRALIGERRLTVQDEAGDSLDDWLVAKNKSKKKRVAKGDVSSSDEM